MGAPPSPAACYSPNTLLPLHCLLSLSGMGKSHQKYPWPAGLFFEHLLRMTYSAGDGREVLHDAWCLVGRTTCELLTMPHQKPVHSKAGRLMGPGKDNGYYDPAASIAPMELSHLFLMTTSWITQFPVLKEMNLLKGLETCPKFHSHKVVDL